MFTARYGLNSFKMLEASSGAEGGNNGGNPNNGGTGGGDSFTQDQVNQIVEERINRDREKVRSDLRAELAQEYSDKQTQAKKLEEMNDTEKAQYERDQVQAEKDKLEKQLNRISTEKTVTAMLSEQGIVASDGLLNALVHDDMDAEAIKTTVKEFSELFNNSVNEKVQDEVKAKMAGKTPSRFGNGDSSASGDSVGADLAKKANESRTIEAANDPWSKK